jgi:hypothetical protein
MDPLALNVKKERPIDRLHVVIDLADLFSDDCLNQAR